MTNLNQLKAARGQLVIVINEFGTVDGPGHAH